MPALFDYGPSANCLKVRVLLRQLGIDCERIETDIFAGESRTEEYVAMNPAGRTPVLRLDDGRTIAESNAILLYLAEGTRMLPADRVEQAHVHQWMFFEQNLVEPNLGTARFWRLTGRDAQRPEAWAQRREAGEDALTVLDCYLGDHDFLVENRYSAADIAVYGYTHVAHEAGVDMARYPSIASWLARVEATDGFENDLQPYPANALAPA